MSAAGPAHAALASSALLTDRYELTMLDAARRAGVADRSATFEVFTRRLPPGRVAGVHAGLGRLLEAIEAFRFGDDELGWLADEHVVSDGTLEWLSTFRFAGDIDGYPEGEWYGPGSPVLTVSGTFAETVLLETLVLSVLNFDSAVAAAASLFVGAAGDRPIIEMGSRRTDSLAAVAAARAAWLAGFASTSNLEAGRRYGIPTAGTAAHAFTLAFATEREAFAAQVEALGASTTLLVDTYDLEEGIRNAVAVAGPRLGAVRIDSGDLPEASWQARRLLDELGARDTGIVVTGDLDDVTILELAGTPVTAFGVGTNVVTGLGAPTAGLVYKLVSIGGADGGARPVAKTSPGKASVGGRKVAWRGRSATPPPDATAAPARPGPVLVDWVGADGRPPEEAGEVRPLQRRVVAAGVPVGAEDLREARERHRQARRERAGGEPVVVSRY